MSLKKFTYLLGGLRDKSKAHVITVTSISWMIPFKKPDAEHEKKLVKAVALKRRRFGWRYVSYDYSLAK